MDENKTNETLAQGEVERRLREELARSEAANRAKTTFLSNMSHDIRTPMNAIMGYTGLAIEHIDDKERLRDYLSKINQASNHLLALINDVLDMSNIESGKLLLDEKEENLLTIIRTVQNIVQADIRAKDLNFYVGTVDLEDEDVVCDRLRLNQMLLNILSNAIKYTPAGGTVSLQVREKGVSDGYGSYEFRIKDNGVGMGKELLELIYDPFTRARTAAAAGMQSTGLGMTITKNIVDLMKGTIEIKSEPGKGTEVIVNLVLRLRGTAAPEPAVSASEYDFRGRRVLLAEDDELNREITVDLLREYGIRVDAVEDGDVAVEKMRNARVGDYDLVLMDIQMPRLDGYEATRQIRALGTEVSRLPILAMTANAYEEDHKAALMAGMNAYIAKPINVEVLKATLARFL